MILKERPTNQQIWTWLDKVPDPEIPVISVTDLGIVRDVSWSDDTLVIKVTPTYSGCPATSIINFDIEVALRNHGIDNLRIERQLSPALTSDWIKPEARDKLRQFGIAPPVSGTAADGNLLKCNAHSGGSNFSVACPHCNSTNTEKISQSGSTACKASYRCKDCLEPFDYFKCI